MKHTRAALLAGLTITAASVGAFVPAHAADSDGTIVTFELTKGDLSISDPTSANLGSKAVGSLNVSGKLGTVRVDDDRGGLSLLWTATVSSTPFTHESGEEGLTIPGTSVSYAPGAPTETSGGLSVFTPTPGVLGLPLPVMTGINPLGSNWAEWDPTLTITLPGDQAVGTYTGTITHSVT